LSLLSWWLLFNYFWYQAPLFLQKYQHFKLFSDTPKFYSCISLPSKSQHFGPKIHYFPFQYLEQKETFFWLLSNWSPLYFNIFLPPKLVPCAFQHRAHISEMIDSWWTHSLRVIPSFSSTFKELGLRDHDRSADCKLSWEFWLSNVSYHFDGPGDIATEGHIWLLGAIMPDRGQLIYP